MNICKDNNNGKSKDEIDKATADVKIADKLGTNIADRDREENSSKDRADIDGTYKPSKSIANGDKTDNSRQNIADIEETIKPGIARADANKIDKQKTEDVNGVNNSATTDLDAAKKSGK